MFLLQLSCPTDQCFATAAPTIFQSEIISNGGFRHDAGGTFEICSAAFDWCDLSDGDVLVRDGANFGGLDLAGEYLRLDGSNAMSGNLDTATNDLANVGALRGTDTAHLQLIPGSGQRVRVGDGTATRQYSLWWDPDGDGALSRTTAPPGSPAAYIADTLGGAWKELGAGDGKVAEFSNNPATADAVVTTSMSGTHIEATEPLSTFVRADDQGNVVISGNLTVEGSTFFDVVQQVVENVTDISADTLSVTGEVTLSRNDASIGSVYQSDGGTTIGRWSEHPDAQSGQLHKWTGTDWVPTSQTQEFQINTLKTSRLEPAGPEGLALEAASGLKLQNLTGGAHGAVPFLATAGGDVEGLTCPTGQVLTFTSGSDPACASAGAIDGFNAAVDAADGVGSVSANDGRVCLSLAGEVTCPDGSTDRVDLTVTLPGGSYETRAVEITGDANAASVESDGVIITGIGGFSSGGNGVVIQGTGSSGYADVVLNGPSGVRIITPGTPGINSFLVGVNLLGDTAWRSFSYASGTFDPLVGVDPTIGPPLVVSTTVVKEGMIAANDGVETTLTTFPTYHFTATVGIAKGGSNSQSLEAIMRYRVGVSGGWNECGWVFIGGSSGSSGSFSQVTCVGTVSGLPDSTPVQFGLVNGPNNQASSITTKTQSTFVFHRVKF